MKTSSLKRLCYCAAALSLVLGANAWAQNSGNTGPQAVPATVSPVQAADQAATNAAGDAQKPIMDSSLNKEAPSPDSVLTKLKENASPVSINDMIAAQDVITRLDLISQIEDKMSKIDDARAKRLAAAAAATAPVSPAGVNPATLPGGSLLPGQAAAPAMTNLAAMSALQQAMPSGMGSSRPAAPIALGIAQVLAISGANGDYSALLQLDGHQLNVKNGSTVPGVGVVSNIDAKSVTIIKPNGKATNVAFTQN